MGRHIQGVQVVDVEKRREPSKHYVYVIFVTWSDGCSFVVYRRYSRFFDLQSKLLDMFPIEAGSVDPEERKIPFLPGKIIFGRSHIREVAMKRMKPIDEYCKKIIGLPEKISQCEEVLNFFEVDADDLDPPALSNKLKDQQQTAEKISKPKQLDQFVVICDYQPADKGEVSLQAGAKVEVIEKNESGWWFVNAEDEQGWVPSTYLEPISGSKDNTVLRAKPGEEEKYICIADYTPSDEAEPDEIPLGKGAVVDVVEKNLDGWWIIRFQGRQGVAPATYLMKAKDVQAQHLAEQSRNSGVEIISNLSYISNIVSRGAQASDSAAASDGRSSSSGSDALSRAIKKRTLERGGSLKPPPRQNSITASVSEDASPPSTPRSHYATLADFTAQMDDGISFRAGQDVQVLEKTSTGWWFIQIDDKEGWAPASFIESKVALSEDTSSMTSKPTEEEDFSGSDHFDDSDDERTQKSPAAALASALRGQVEKKPPPPLPPSKSGSSIARAGSAASKPAASPSKPATSPSKPAASPSKPAASPSRPAASPSKPAASPSKPALGSSGPPSTPFKPTSAGKPQMPPKLPGSGKNPAGDRVEDAPDSAASSEESKRASEVAPGGNAFLTQLRSQLQAGNRGRQSAVEKENDTETSSSAPSASGPSAALLTPKPFKPQLPKKAPPATPGAPAPPRSTESSAKVPLSTRPSLPKKPPMAEKPKLAQKPSLHEKPRPPSKTITKTASVFNKDEPKEGKPAGPPKLPSQPPKLPSKPAANAKPKPDTNNNKGNNSDSHTGSSASGGVHGLAAALKTKLESSSTPRPHLPSKAPASSVRNGSAENSIPGRESHADRSGNSHADKAQDVPKANVGNLVSALSGKLNFGGPAPEMPSSRHSAAARDSSPGHVPTPKSVSSMTGQAENSAKPPTSSSSEKYFAIGDFTGETDTEISLREGDEAEVLERCNEDWWLVRIQGREGYAPSSFLEPCSSASQPASAAASAASSLAARQLSTASSSASPQYTTCAVFVAENEGELGFEEGIILDDILDSTDPDWWLISYGGHEGWAPASYIVETVPPRVESLRGSASKPLPSGSSSKAGSSARMW